MAFNLTSMPIIIFPFCRKIMIALLIGINKGRPKESINFYFSFQITPFNTKNILTTRYKYKKCHLAPLSLFFYEWYPIVDRVNIQSLTFNIYKFLLKRAIKSIRIVFKCIKVREFKIMETLNYLKNKNSLTYFTALVNQTNASIMGLMTNIDTMHTLGNEILHTPI